MAFALVGLAWLAAVTARAAFPGENGRIAFAKPQRSNEASSDIWVVNPDGSDETRLSCDGRGSQPAWSPDGRRIAFVGKVSARVETGPISVMDADGTDHTRVGRFGVGPVWSPTGRRIAFLAWGVDPLPLLLPVALVNADGSGPFGLPFNNAAALTRQPWSPDGRRLAVDSFIFDPETGQAREFTDIGRTPTWSPGGVIAFRRRPSADPHSGPSKIWKVNPDGSGETQVTEGPESDAEALWSPDGQRIAFLRAGDLWVMNADGSDQRPVTASGDVSSHAWSPDGRRIAFRRIEGGGIWSVHADRGDATRLANRSAVEGRLDWQPLPDGSGLGPPPSQFCFERARRNLKRGIARLIVEVPRPGRVVLHRRPGVMRFAGARRDENGGRVVVKVRPRGKSRHRLDNRTNRLPVRAQVTYRPSVGEPRTKGRRVWLVKR